MIGGTTMKDTIRALLSVVLLVACHAEKYPAGFIKAAEELEVGMDLTVDPCVDFYQFSCGNWPLNNTNPHDSDVFSKMTWQVLYQMADKFDHISTEDGRLPAAYRQAKMMYNACMQPPPSDLTVDLVLLNKLLKSFGGWPVLQTDYAIRSGGAAGLLGSLIGKYNFETLVIPQVTSDLWKPGHNTILFDGRTLQNGPNENGTIVPYIPDRQELTDVAGDRKLNPIRLAHDAAQIADIEIGSITKFWEVNNWILPDPYAIPPDMYNPFDVSSAIRKWPNINWPVMLMNIANGNTDLFSMFGSSFVIAKPAYFDYIDDLFSRQPPQVMQNYLLWKLVELEASMLPSMRHLYLKYGKGAQDTPIEIHCANKLVDHLPAITSRLYAEASSLNQFDIDELNTMIGLHLGAWHGMIGEVEWISESSRQNAYAKISNVAQKVGYPKWIFNDVSLDEYYSNLNATVFDDAYVLLNKLMRFSAWKQISIVGQVTDRYSWETSSATVNAWYRPDMNSITFPSAIMQSPCFNSTYPKSVNYGNTGATMGHELGHAFDSGGVFWGPHGGYKPNSWMDPDSLAGFNKMADCVSDQYFKYCFPDLPDNPCINGNQTITENVADIAGTIAAHRSFKAVQKLMGGEEQRLPGVMGQFNHEQIFFIAYAQTWCNKYDDKTLEWLLKNDVHSPARYRTMGVVQDMPEFASTFSCPLGSPMAPKEHCSVWVKPH